MKRLFILTLALLMLAGCTTVEIQTESTASPQSAATTAQPTEAPTASAPTEADKTKAELTLENMSLREKIGQLFIVRPEALGGNQTGFDANMAAVLEKYPVGGVALFAKNIVTPEGLTAFTYQLNEYGMFIGIDEEGGTVSRIAKNDNFKVQSFHSMGKIEGESAARYVGETIGGYLKKYGVNLDFAPVADVNSNPDNPVIGQRAFSDDPQIVAEMVSAQIDGFHKGGVMTAIKHFPGHGDTNADTHTGYVSLDKTWEELKECELIPFENNLGKTDMVMISHITLPKVTEDGLPAALSYDIITEKLRNEMGYGGVVITDSMEMGAVTSAFGTESAVMAIKAGADIVLMPLSLEESFEAVVDAVEKGEITEERLNESVLRVLELKEKYGILPLQ